MAGAAAYRWHAADRHVDDGDALAGTLARGRLLWDALKVELNGIQARLENGNLAGTMTVDLRGARPVYRLVSHLRSMD